MNLFVEGLQGSGKSTLVQKISEKLPEYTAVREGDYSPVELVWCAYVTKEKYREILDKYSSIRADIEAKSHEEGNRMIVCYTQIMTDIPGFHKDLEQYEIYNGRVSFADYKEMVLRRYRAWSGDKGIYECSLFQNSVEDMILFRCASDDEIVDFYREVRGALSDKEYHIVYLQAEDVAGNINIIRKERSDENGNEMWFPLMLDYFDHCPYALKKGVAGADALIAHLEHRQKLELRLLKEVFEDRYTILKSKAYSEADFSNFANI